MSQGRVFRLLLLTLCICAGDASSHAAELECLKYLPNIGRTVAVPCEELQTPAPSIEHGAPAAVPSPPPATAPPAARADPWGDCVQSKDRDLSIRACTEVIAQGQREKNDLVFAYFYRGTDYRDKGDFDRAIADYTKAIELDPTYAPAYSGRGTVYSRKGDRERAGADLSKGEELYCKKQGLDKK